MTHRNDKSRDAPIQEHNNHPLLSEDMCHRLENLQRIALQLIYGYQLSYEKLREKADIPTLKEQRNDAMRKFALKMSGNERFKDDWFPLNTPDDRLRHREKYVIEMARSERFRKGHLNFMRRILNTECD